MTNRVIYHYRDSQEPWHVTHPIRQSYLIEVLKNWSTSTIYSVEINGIHYNKEEFKSWMLITNGILPS